MKCVILAAGKGKRMRPLTLNTPKPMIEVLGRPLLHHIIDSLPEEVDEIILVVGYLQEQIKKYFKENFEGRKITYVEQKERKGTAHALFLCKKFLKNEKKFLFMFADDFHSAGALKRLIKKDIGILVQEHPEPHRFGVVEIDKNNVVVDIEEKPEKPKTNLVAVGVYLVNNSFFDHPLVLSSRGEYEYPEQIMKMIKNHDFVVEVSEFWHPIGYPHEVETAKELLLKGQKDTEFSDIKVVILSGGHGTRMPEEERDKPKCLVNIAGKPILAHQLDQLKKQGFHNITVSLGHRADQVITWLKQHGYTDVKCVVESEPLGTGGALKLASKGDKKPFLSLFGDIIADFDFRAIIRASCKGKFSVITGVKLEDVSGMGVLMCDEDMRICEFKEKQAEGVSGLINANASVIDPKDLEKMPDKFSFECDFCPKLIKKGKLVIHKHNGNYWFDCGTSDRLGAVRDFFTKFHK